MAGIGYGAATGFGTGGRTGLEQVCQLNLYSRVKSHYDNKGRKGINSGQ